MDETHGIVPVSGPCPGRKAPRPARPWPEFALCVLGSLVSVALPVIGMVAMVFGAWLLNRSEERRGWWAIAGCVVPGIVLSFVSWVNYGSLVAPFIIGALVVAFVLPGRISITSVCLTIIGMTALMIASDASIVMMWGESFMAYVAALLDEIRELTAASLGGSSSSVVIMASVDRTVELLGKVWPLLYVSRAAVAVLAGLLGLMLARRDTYQRVYQAFTRYDMPLWGVVALIVAVACMAGSAAGFPASSTLEAVGLNILFCLRVLFFLQGLAVAMCLMDRHRWGAFSRMLVLALLLMAELGFYAVSVFGVIDVWANFRKLPRHKTAVSAGSHDEGE